VSLSPVCERFSLLVILPPSAERYSTYVLTACMRAVLCTCVRTGYRWAVPFAYVRIACMSAVLVFTNVLTACMWAVLVFTNVLAACMWAVLVFTNVFTACMWAVLVFTNVLTACLWAVLVFTCFAEGGSRSRNRFLRPYVCSSVRPSQYLLSVICNSNSFQSILFKLCTVFVYILQMCTSYYGLIWRFVSYMLCMLNLVFFYHYM
jgi:hypothetical protein